MNELLVLSLAGRIGEDLDLDAARGRAGKLLGKASPFTEKVAVKGSTLYRARFSGFNEPDDAEKACKALKKSGFSCFASRV